MMLSQRELQGAILAGASQVGTAELGDPNAWCDFAAATEGTATLVQKRITSASTPHRAHVLPWPKDRGGTRPMVWLDPLDQVLYRAVTGRLLLPIERSLNRDAVMSAKPIGRHPLWSLAPHGPQVGMRRRRATALRERHPVMGSIDIKNFFPSVSRAALRATVGRLSVDQPTFDYLLDWLDRLHSMSEVQGLPTGHEPSQILATAVMSAGDRALLDAGVPFLRYVDDVWFFVDTLDEYDEVRALYTERIRGLGLDVHPDKTRALIGPEADEEIERSAFRYLGDALKDPGDEGADAAMELLGFALESPVDRRSELRRAIGVLGKRCSLGALAPLQEDPELLRIAPEQWARDLRTLVRDPQTRRAVDPDWLVGEVLGNQGQETAFVALQYLKVLAAMHVDKARGRQILEVADAVRGWASPVRVWAVSAWAQSQAYKPALAVDRVEEHGDFSTKRAFALTLKGREGRNRESWLHRVRLADPELRPTHRWLTAA